MVDSQLHAIFVKVAALGLEPHKHLGKSIAQLQPYLHRLNALYGSNVCGEGGEYETLTLDCPAFTHGRIVLDEFEVRKNAAAPRAGAAEAYLSPLLHCPACTHVRTVTDEFAGVRHCRTCKHSRGAPPLGLPRVCACSRVGMECGSGPHRVQ